MSDERNLLAWDRTLLAWIRTSTSLLTFGFGIYKLLQQEAVKPGDHPILEIVSPKVIGLIMILSGFIGLLISTLSYIKFARTFGKTPWQTYTAPVVLQAFVVLALCLLILIGAVLGG